MYEGFITKSIVKGQAVNRTAILTKNIFSIGELEYMSRKQGSLSL